MKMKTNYIGPETSPPDLRQYWRGDHPYLTSLSGEWTGALVDHPEPIPAEFDDHGVQMTLPGMHTRMADLIAEAAATRDSLNASGQTNYQITAYEGGPSGYWTNEDDPEIDELYGKSVAMGVAALDAWLFSSQYGYQYQCYLGFKSGEWWSSHTMPESGGYRPHPGWLALQLRNRYTNLFVFETDSSAEDGDTTDSSDDSPNDPTDDSTDNSNTNDNTGGGGGGCFLGIAAEDFFVW